jgi:hypothetical protein
MSETTQAVDTQAQGARERNQQASVHAQRQMTRTLVLIVVVLRHVLAVVQISQTLVRIVIAICSAAAATARILGLQRAFLIVVVTGEIHRAAASASAAIRLRPALLHEPWTNFGLGCRCGCVRSLARPLLRLVTLAAVRSAFACHVPALSFVIVFALALATRRART